jgi:hypothetical protein
LVACAAIASKKIYSNREIGVGGVVTVAGPDVRPSGNIKAFSVYSDIVDNKHVLILTIRGSVNKQDWFVNLNGAPRLSKQVCDDHPTGTIKLIALRFSMALFLSTLGSLSQLSRWSPRLPI